MLTATTNLRSLPAMQALLQHPEIIAASHALTQVARKNILTHWLQQLRLEAQQTGVVPHREMIIQRCLANLKQLQTLPGMRIINATGVLLHTNLGRAPLAEAAIAYIKECCAHYSNLEYDLESSQRQPREQHLIELFIATTGAASCCVVNNNAASLQLIAMAIATNHPIVLSRGEMIEIGEGFRLHELLASVNPLLPVGSTNCTHLKDYQDALAQTKCGLLLKVHLSNFNQTGFTQSVDIASLAKLAKSTGVPLVVDLGSSTLPQAQAALTAGADLICFSGDKLLGACQAGIILGDRQWVSKLRHHPLYRALRLDKVNLNLLTWVMQQQLQQPDAVPLQQLQSRSPTQMQVWAEQLQEQCQATLARHGFTTQIISMPATMGGGAMGTTLEPAIGLCLQGCASAMQALDRWLKKQQPAVVAALQQQQLQFNLRTLLNQSQLDQLAQLLASYPGNAS